MCVDGPEPCRVRFAAISGSVGIGHIGFNFELGVGRGTDTGRFLFGKIGMSGGAGIAIGVEAGEQNSTTEEFLGNPDGNTITAAEIEAGPFNVPVDASPDGNWRPTGGGVNIGFGLFVGVNFTARADYVGLDHILTLLDRPDEEREEQ